MSILIKNMDMPTSCDRCDFSDGYYCRRQWDDEKFLIPFYTEEAKRKGCPLVEIPKRGEHDEL